ncbi:MAG TPA: protein-disulfide reductase DsbD N-terminal domain-containing protein [Terriglobales bacterium]|nr:protein-disulfide reductase DsbD N-terminal domain-containing protein [Terriglobales bacterium]
MRRAQLILTLAVLLAGAAAQQRGNRASFVTVEPLPRIELGKGKASSTLEIRMRVNKGFHINSNKPTSDLLIPTEIKFLPAAGITIGKIKYPNGHDYNLAIAPQEKLSVYTDMVAVSVSLSSAKGAKPGARKVHGTLTYQACDDNSCYPPKTVPLDLEVLLR